MDATRGLHDRPTYASSMHGYRGNSTRIMSKSKEVNKYKVMEVVGVYAVSGTTKEKRQPERENQPSTNKTVAIQDNRRMVSRSKAMLNATVHRKPKNEETKKKKKKKRKQSKQNAALMQETKQTKVRLPILYQYHPALENRTTNERGITFMTCV